MNSNNTSTIKTSNTKTTATTTKNSSNVSTNFLSINCNGKREFMQIRPLNENISFSKVTVINSNGIYNNNQNNNNQHFNHLSP